MLEKLVTRASALERGRVFSLRLPPALATVDRRLAEEKNRLRWLRNRRRRRLRWLRSQGGNSAPAEELLAELSSVAEERCQRRRAALRWRRASLLLTGRPSARKIMKLVRAKLSPDPALLEPPAASAIPLLGWGRRQLLRHRRQPRAAPSPRFALEKKLRQRAKDWELIKKSFQTPFETQSYPATPEEEEVENSSSGKESPSPPPVATPGEVETFSLVFEGIRYSWTGVRRQPQPSQEKAAAETAAAGDGYRGSTATAPALGTTPARTSEDSAVGTTPSPSPGGLSPAAPPASPLRGRLRRRL